jgi:methyl-accepting chemotaxis protein
MDWVKNMKVGHKLMAAFGSVTLLMGVLGYVGLSNTITFSSNFKSLYADRLMPAVQLSSVVNNFLQLRMSSLQFLMARTPEERAKIQHADEARVATITDQMKAYASTKLLPAEVEGLKSWNDKYPVYMASRQRMIDLYLAGHVAESDELRARETVPLGIEAMAVIDKLSDLQATTGAEMNKDVAAQAKTSMMLMILLLIVAPLLAIGAGFVLSRSIVGSLNHVVERATLAATGDLRVRVTVDSTDELGQMGEQLNIMMQSFEDNMTKVAMASQAITTASGELSAASQSISSGAQEQASSLEETAASLEQMTSAVKQNADNAQQAAQLAQGARDVAEKGGKVVNSAVEAMTEINASSRKIADIITAIDEIAFQTNLLALNAAVEAARAGEQGRGFAVVAGEVRNLAQRSASAAKEIKGLINDSVDKVESGSKLVNQSGSHLEEIVASVKRVTDIVGEIAASSREQSTGIEQVNTAVTQMDAVTQSNASQTEELAGTADGLSGQAQSMMTLVQQFKLSDNGHASGAMVTSSRPKAKAKVLPMRKAGVHNNRKPAPVPAPMASAATGTDGFEEF